MNRSDPEHSEHLQSRSRGKGSGWFSAEHLSRLEEISRACSCPVRPDFVASCSAFLKELARWNARVNLISANDMERVVDRHVLDSLCLLTFVNDLKNKRMLDVGAGAGFPGLVLALWDPRSHAVLLESRSKPIAFLRNLRRKLAIDNVEIVHARLESLAASESQLAPMDIVTSRAVGGHAELARAASRLLKPGGVIVFYATSQSAGRIADGLLATQQEVRLEQISPPWQSITVLLVAHNLA